jgi:hypothetical protein
MAKTTRPEKPQTKSTARADGSPVMLSLKPSGRPADHDGNLQAYVQRMVRLEDILVNRCGLSRAAAESALTSPDPKTKEPAARGLRRELKRLQDGQRTTGKAPVLNGQAMSPLDIGDLAATMLEAHGLGTEFTCLVLELLKIDRRRRALAERRPPSYYEAAMIEGYYLAAGAQAVGVRELARAFDVNPSTASAWRKEPEYKLRVQAFKEMWLSIKNLTQEEQERCGVAYESM